MSTRIGVARIQRLDSFVSRMPGGFRRTFEERVIAFVDSLDELEQNAIDSRISLRRRTLDYPDYLSFEEPEEMLEN